MKKGSSFFSFSFSSAILVVSLFLLLHLDVSIAIPWKANATTVGDLWEEEEFSMNSHFGRMLYDLSKSVTGKAGNKGQPGISNCPRTQNYRNCLPNPNGGGPRQKCGDYNRNC
ncbi:hypothetical protein VNO77_21382 [Canavalia gladiata]|uniref:Rapid ALkalinization Factor n=1 Tax=Canavalia gladiata TaxID=3824 RepID=A0AAN9LVL4_CANGL